MRIAVTATGPSLDDHVEARFGRCAYRVRSVRDPLPEGRVVVVREPLSSMRTER
jgi:predicted Fe-Mo cluster-binding NifX family protein